MVATSRSLAAPLPTPPSRPDSPAYKAHSYGEILHSSMLIGASSIATLALGLVRTKVLALLLGPAGFGLFGIFVSVADLARAIAGMGISNSGVRQIAESVSSAERERITTTAGVLRRVAWLLGLAAAALLVIFCRPISRFTFGTDAHATGIALLSIAVCLRLVADGQGALIQGMRRVADLAKSNVLAAFLGTLAAVPFVFFLGPDGVVPSLIAAAAMVALCQWWYCRKLRAASHPLTVPQFRREALSLLKLGLAFMASGLLMMGVAYIVRIIVARNVGLEAAGFYQAAWLLGGLYVSFILQAMGTDFYPRLVGVAKDNAACTRLVNEQARVSLLLTGPGVIATLALAPLAIAILYSAEFSAAVGVLRWICLGMTLRVITWPMGFIIVAQNRQWVFFLTELAWSLVNVGLSWICVQRFGLEGAGIAFFGSYVFHGFMIYPVVRVLCGFRWSAQNRLDILLFLAFASGTFVALNALPPMQGMTLSALLLAATTWYSLRALAALAPIGDMPGSVRRAIRLLRLPCWKS